MPSKTILMAAGCSRANPVSEVMPEASEFIPATATETPGPPSAPSKFSHAPCNFAGGGADFVADELLGRMLTGELRNLQSGISQLYFQTIDLE